MIVVLIVIVVALTAAVIWQRMEIKTLINDIETKIAERDIWKARLNDARHEIDVTQDRLITTGHKLDAATNRLAAQAVQVEHYPALQTVNADYVRIVCGLKDRLKTTEQMPYGVYTHKFEHISGLVLYLIDSGACAPKNDDEREAKIKESIKAKVN